jgi:small GTP-binding protein
LIQKKICMVGVFATGKTSLVRQFVDSIFSERYLSTVGVKIDRKQIEVDGSSVNLLLWDLEGRDGVQDIRTSYIKGAAGILYVVDGTRRETFEQLFDLQRVVTESIGEVPSIVALNKRDLENEWRLEEDDYERLRDRDWQFFKTSAKTGRHVERAFHWLALETLRS